MTTKNFVVKNGVTTGNIILDAATGNITSTNANLGNAVVANYFIGNFQGNLQVTGGNTQVVFNDDGSANASAAFTFNKTNNTVSISNVLSVTGNITGGNVNTTTVTASTLVSNVATGTAPFTVTSTTQVANLNVATAGTATSATNAAALLQNTSTATTVYPTFTTSSANGNSSVVINTSINANLGNASITATTFVGALSGAATTAGTVTTNAQPNITSTGTLTSLTVSGTSNLGPVGNVTITGGSSGYYLQTNGSGTLTWAAVATGTGISNGTSNVNIPASNGNINMTVGGNANILVITGTGANITGTFGVSANANVGNLDTAGLITATGNVSGGNLTTAGAVAATGNVSGGNLTTGGAVVATGNVSGGNLTTAGILSVTGTGVSSIAGNLDMTSNNIINLATPVNSTDAATKQYVDDVAQGLNVHDAAAAATPATLASITSGTITYNNGTSGVGATLTTSSSYTTIDGVNVATIGTRILVKNEANAAHNGVYTYTGSTVITRATDYNTVPEVEAGDFIFVTGGTTYDNTGWVQTSTVATIGTDPIDFTQFSGAGTYSAGTGLTLTGSTFSVNASQTQVTAVGTLGTLTVSGNANVGNLGTAGLIVATGNVSGGNVNATTAVVASTLTSNVAIGTAPITVTSTTRVNNLNVAYANVADFINVTTQTSGNAYLLLGNALTGNVAETANSVFVANTSNGALYATTFVGSFSGAASTAATVTTNAQPNITSTGTLSSLAVTGNVTSGNLITTNVLLSSIQSNRANVSVTTNTVIDQFAPATYRSAKYVISASSANGFQSVEAILVHNGTDSFVTIYASVCSNATADIVDISSNINGGSGNTTLYATSSGGTATVNLVATYLKT